jgi:hypothetical protein
MSLRAFPSAFREINLTVFIYFVSVLLLVELSETEFTFSCKSLGETGCFGTMMSVEHWSNNGQRYHFVHHKSHVDCHWIGPGIHVKKLVSSHMNCGMTRMSLTLITGINCKRGRD